MHETSNHDALQQLAKLGERFSGVSLDFRRHAAGTGWPAPWRARLAVSKNERGDYRSLFSFGNTAEQAIEALREAVARLDREHREVLGLL
ncbi:MAG: hypothetical protein KAX77_00835 [Xanthomonadales bacterium]|nr:hypothetical protein [Xanthomonadales bacterium]